MMNAIMKQELAALVALSTISSALLTDEYSYRTRVEHDLSRRFQPETASRVEAAEDLYFLLDSLARDPDETEFVLDVIEDVLAWLDDEEEIWVRYYLLMALGDLTEGDPRVVDMARWIMMTFLEDFDPSLRGLAARKLENLMSDEAESMLLAAYNVESHWWARASMLATLGAGSGQASLRALHEALDDPVRDVRSAASEALLQRASPGSIVALARASKADDLVGYDSPVAALAVIEDDAALPPLREASDSVYPVVRALAAGGLGKRADQASRALLQRMLADPDESVAEAAAQALAALGGSDGVVHAIGWLASHSSAKVLASLRNLPRLDLEAGCLELRSSEDSTTLCESLLAQSDQPSPTYITVGGQTDEETYSPYNASARRVAPECGEAILGWETAVGTRNFGDKILFEQGATVWITDHEGFLYEGETWLMIHGGEWEEDGWVRESDLEPVPPDELLHSRGQRLP